MVRVTASAKGGGGSGTTGNRNTGVNREMEWSLRSLRKIDTNAKYFANNYSDSDDSDSDSDFVEQADQSAYEIFKAKPSHETNGQKSTGGGGQKRGLNQFGGGNFKNISGNIYGPSSVWAALNVPLRTGVVDGRKVVFELLTNVTKLPKTPRSQRLKRKHVIINASKSLLETRLRLWLMHFNLTYLSIAFFAAFIFVNFIFAGLFYWNDTRCCGDPDFTFADVFNFAFQSSSTIGYGTYSPSGDYANFLVVILSYISTLINTLFAGLLFTKFVTPVINIQFSEVMTLANVNGVPCLSVRLGAPDGDLNPLTDINVRLTYSYRIPYSDAKGNQKHFQQTEELRLLSNRQHGLKEVWTLRHVLDESSPLFGLHFQEHPGNKIYVFTLSVDAVQNLTKSSVNVQTEYALEDILIGHTFQNVTTRDETTNPPKYIADFAKLSLIEPYPVWYPALSGIYSEDRLAFNSTKTYGV